MVADPARWAALRPAKLVPSSDAVPDRFEYGTPSFPLLAGVAAAVDHLAGLDPDAVGDRRARLRAGLAAAQAYEEALLDRLLAGLAQRPAVTVLRLAGAALPDRLVPGRRDVTGGQPRGAGRRRVLPLRRRLLRLRVLPG